jgi:hypothetical protein
MSLDVLKEQIELLFNPEPLTDGRPELPHPTLKQKYKLDLDYMWHSDWEGSSVHRYTRQCGSDEQILDALTRNSDMPNRLMLSALRIFADSVIAYYGKDPREGEIRFYPSVILTFWSGFESYVRYTTELLLATVPTVPEPIRDFLSESERIVSADGSIEVRTRYRSVLDRFSVFIAYAYGRPIDRGNTHWQNLRKANELRDYYTHIEAHEARAITSQEVFEFLEAVLLGLIWPSSIFQRTFLIGQYFLHGICEELKSCIDGYKERPFFMDWQLKERRLFHCNFENVDAVRFPSVRDTRDAGAPKLRS